jgi:uncharacterized protein (TIGR01777 family)
VNVAVSGSTGLIGSALVEELVRAGIGVVRLVRPSSRPVPSHGSSDDVPAVEWDPRTAERGRLALTRLGPIDAIVNLAGAGIGDRRWTAARKRELRESRLRSTRAAVDLVRALEPRPRVLVNASAVGFYGDRGGDLLTESSAAGQGFLAELCVEWEQAAAQATSAGARTVVVRSGIVVAPRGGALARQVLLFRLGLGGRLGPGTQYRSWISLEDEVAALVRCLQDESLSGPVNLTAPTPVTDAEFAAALARALGRKARLAVPATVLRAALGTELAEEVLLAGQRVVPATLSAAGFTFSHPTVDEALHWALDR